VSTSLLATPVETLAFQIFHDVISLRTSASVAFIDITDEVQSCVRSAGIQNGVVNVQTQHTTASVLVNENEPLLLEDLRRALEELAPRCTTYRHDDFAVRTTNMTPDEKANGHAHCKAIFLRASEMLNVANGELQLGRWQRIFFVELDCPRDRTVSVLVMGS
jgi:secondary thiamine-phosphate synthase enzyme